MSTRKIPMTETMASDTQEILSSIRQELLKVIPKSGSDFTQKQVKILGDMYAGILAAYNAGVTDGQP